MTKNAEKIAHLDDERGAGNGWLVYLKPGWAIRDANTANAQHCFGEETKAAVWRTMKDAAPCQCAECLTLLAKAAA